MARGFLFLLMLFFAAIFAASLLGYLAFFKFELREVIALGLEPHKEQIGERGNYLDFIIGIPIALVGVAATAFLAYIGNNLVQRQAEIQAIELADAKIARELNIFILLINAFDEAIDVGEEIRDVFIPRLIRDCLEKDVRPIDVLRFHTATYDPDSDDFGLNEEGADPAIIELRRKWAPLFMKVSKTVEKDMADIFDGFQRLTLDPFWSTALAYQIGDHERKFSQSESQWARPMVTMYTLMGQAVQADAIKSPRALGRELRLIAKNTKAWHSIHAFLFTPKEATALEFVGAILSLSDKDGLPAATAYNHEKKENENRIARGEGPVKELKLYNLAAAMLISLYKALPSKAAVETAFENLFPDAGKSGSNVYFRVLPNKRKVTSDALLDMIDYHYANPSQLVYSENLVNKRPQTMRADDLKHGHSPRSFWSGLSIREREKKAPPMYGGSRGRLQLTDEEMELMRADIGLNVNLTDSHLPYWRNINK